MSAKKPRYRKPYGRGEPFAAIPRKVIESDAYHALPDWAVRVLVGLVAQYNGNNNGDLSITTANYQRLGVRSRHHVYAALKVLEAAGLIVRTRQGGKPPVGCSLYGVTWRALNPSEKFDGSVRVTEKPSDEWRLWTKPANWEEFVRKAKRSSKQGRTHRAGYVQARERDQTFAKPPLGGRACAQQPGTTTSEIVPTVGVLTPPVVVPDQVVAS
jgi:hypothetical protein